MMSLEKTLLPHHRDMLMAASGIGEDVATTRGYFSATKKAELKALGFPDSQQIVPTLVCPVWSVLGDVRHYQHRPDHPRVREGKAVKYETLAGKTMIVDVHPNICEQMSDPRVPLFITEGVKKADAAITRGLCCLALLGVWNWRGTNQHGGKTALPDWERIALNGRRVYLCFDSDVMQKREVYAALLRLKEFLEQHGAEVWIIYLPSGDSGRKMGLDDFLAEGNTREELLALATPRLRPSVQDERGPACPYRQTPSGLVLVRGEDDSLSVPLTNFGATITAEVEKDNGVDKSRVFNIEVRLKEKTYSFPVPAEQFFSVRRWAVVNIGAGAVVYPSLSCESNAATAIQLLSGDIPQAKVYEHTGWRELEPDFYSYLSAGSVIGECESISASVQLPSPLDRFCLPEPPKGAAAVKAVRASLEILNLGADTLTVPVFASIYRAASGSADFAVFLTGESGVFKSELAALAQQHFGPSMTARNLPASWTSTDNSLEDMAFGAKDALLVIDDYAPRGGQQEQARLAARADRVLRAQGNNSARGRMNGELMARPPHPPRGLILSTGEDIPPGHSLRARNVILEISKRDIDASKLSLCQQDAEAGAYASSMSAYLDWFSPQYDTLQARRRERVKELRAKAPQQGSSHARTPEIVANLWVGIEFFLEFAESVGAISTHEKDILWDRAWRSLLAVGKQQAQHHAAGEPVQRYLELLQSALASGDAHVAAMNGSEPDDPAAWGWRRNLVGTGENEREEWRPQGKRIGWLEGANLYLHPQAAYQVAKRLGEGSSDGIAIGQKTLNRLLRERGLLLSFEEKRGAVARREVQGNRLHVLHLNAANLNNPEAAQTAHTSHQEVNVSDDQGWDSLDGQMSGAVPPQDVPRTGPPEPPSRSPSDQSYDGQRQDGQFGQIPERTRGIPDLPDWNAVEREEFVL